MTESRRVPIRVANKQAYVWDVDDITIIRSKHHICGVLTGTLPHLSQQNIFLGTPLVLMPEEVVLLVENEFAVIIDDSNAYPQPSLSALQSWNADETDFMQQQIAQNEAKDAKESAAGNRAMSDAAIQKRKERLARKAADLTHNNEALTSLDGPSSTALIPPIPDPKLEGSSTTSAAALYNISIPTTSSSLPWYSPETCSYSTISAAKEAGIWDYPANLQERAKCAVFKGLWDQGYFMGGGIKFGGDYLVYPGDPLRYHSHFVASVLESPVATLQPMEIVAHGRLGTATKKAHLLCGWDDEKKEVSYLSIEWAGFG